MIRLLMSLCILSLIYLGSQVFLLKKEVSTLKQISFLSQNQLFDQQRRLSEKYRAQSSAVLSIRCQSNKKEKWNGSGFKISENIVLTAAHLLNRELFSDSKFKNNYPIQCDFYSSSKKVGSFDSEKNNYKYIENQDMVMIKVDFEKAPEIKPLSLIVNHQVYEGEPLIMISHPGEYIEDAIVAFGYVVNANADKIQHKNRIQYWPKAFLTDMIAAPGSSGSPVFTLNEEVIGIHVGGDLNKKLRINHQLLFDTSFFLDFQMFKLQPIIKK